MPGDVDVRTSLSLKEWGAAIHAVLQGRQQVLLRKGGIHEKVFVPPEVADAGPTGGRFLLFPTVAHTHAERTRPEHHDLLAVAEDDATEQQLVVRAGVDVVDVVPVTDPDGLGALQDLHIWTTESVLRDRVEFRPRHPLHVLVVQAIALPEPVVLPRIEAYSGCRSWIDVDLDWDGTGHLVGARDRLLEVAQRVRAAVGSARD